MADDSNTRIGLGLNGRRLSEMSDGTWAQTSNPVSSGHKWNRQNFRKRTEPFNWDERRQKLFHLYKDQFGLGPYKFVVYYFEEVS